MDEEKIPTRLPKRSMNPKIQKMIDARNAKKAPIITPKKMKTKHWTTRLDPKHYDLLREIREISFDEVSLHSFFLTILQGYCRTREAKPLLRVLIEKHPLISSIPRDGVASKLNLRVPERDRAVIRRIVHSYQIPRQDLCAAVFAAAAIDDEFLTLVLGI